jgi:flagellar motor switch/type III secretory pathway protein FliN
LAAGLAERLTTVSKSRCEVNVVSVVQLCADDFGRQAKEDSSNDYHLAFSANKEPSVGVVNLPRQTAVDWIDRLFGKSESADRVLSGLEESLLSDLTVAVIGAFSRACGNVDCRPDGGITKGKWPVVFQSDDELCRITLKIGQADSASLPQADSQSGSTLELIMPCRKLDAAVTGSQTAARPSAEEVSKLIFGHLERIPVCVKVVLGHAAVRLGQIMDLEPDDIIMLDRETDEPVELTMDDRVILRGWLSKSEGQYAVVVGDGAAVKDD